jgi:hypothetical protein
MRHYKILRSVISATCVLLCKVATGAGDVAVVQPVTELGTHSGPGGRFNVVLRENSMGGGTDLFVMKRQVPIFYAADVTGYIWDKGILIYSSLPLYGSGGIYTYDPVMETRSSVIDGKSNEYFELKSFSPETRKLAYFYSDNLKAVNLRTLKKSAVAVREIPIPKK